MTLTGITLSNLVIVPAFDPDLVAYTAVAYNSIAQTTVAATSDNVLDTIVYSPTDADASATGHQVNLTEADDTDITITYTPSGGTAVTITITVTRHAYAMSEIRSAIHGIPGVTCTLGPASQTTPSTGMNLQIIPGGTWSGEEANIRTRGAKQVPMENAIQREWELTGRALANTVVRLKFIDSFYHTLMPEALADLDCEPVFSGDFISVAGGNTYFSQTFKIVSRVHW